MTGNKRVGMFNRWIFLILFLNNWFFSAGINKNDFKGFFGDMRREKYYENNGKRGYEWIPKEQWDAHGLINFNADNF